MEEQNERSENQFKENVRSKSERKIKARRDKKRGVWYGIGMFGLVGWSVTIPALLFLALGIWIDANYRVRYSWTLMVLVVGTAVGCLNAWYWLKSESSDHNKYSNGG